MKIVVNDISAAEGGSLTILHSFYRYVRDTDSGHEWVFLTGSGVIDETERIRVVVQPKVKSNWLRRLAFDLVLGRRLVRSFEPDVVLSLQNTCTYGVSVPQVVYVHQSLPFQRSKRFSFLRKTERSLAVYQYIIGALIKCSIRYADDVIVQTEWMRQAILDQVRIAGDRVACIVPDLEDLSSYASNATGATAEFFYPTADLIYKNNECVLAACRLLREEGVANFEATLTLESCHMEPNVKSIGRIQRAQVLERLGSSTLVFPSLVESYGLPLAEARAIGTIVLAADLPYAREVLHGYTNAYFFAPESPQQLAALMRDVIEGRIVRQCAGERHDALTAPADASAWAKVVKIIETCSDRATRR